MVVRDRIELSTFRFSEEWPGPQRSTADHLSRPDDLIRYLGVQDRLHVSTTVVSTALATGMSTGDLTFRSQAGNGIGLPTPPGTIAGQQRRTSHGKLRASDNPERMLRVYPAGLWPIARPYEV